MKVAHAVGPLRVVAMGSERGALIVFKDACGDASTVLDGPECQRLAQALLKLARVPVGQ